MREGFAQKKQEPIITESQQRIAAERFGLQQEVHIAAVRRGMQQVVRGFVGLQQGCTGPGHAGC